MRYFIAGVSFYRGIYQEYSIQDIPVSIDARIYYTETSNIILNKKYSKSINHGPILSH